MRGSRHERALERNRGEPVLDSPLMEKVWESIVSVAAPIAFMVVAAVVFAFLPNEWRNWLRRWRGVLAAGFFLALATVTISCAVAILVTDDHFGAATPKDAYITGAFLMVLGLAIVGFAVAAYRNNPVR